jgi:hypothetical protein
MGVDVGSHLDLFDLDRLLLLARLGGLLLALVFQLAEIGDLADGRIGVRRNLDEVEARVFGYFQGFIDRNDAAIVALIVDELDPWNPNLTICAGTFLDGRRRFERSANGRCLPVVDGMAWDPERTSRGLCGLAGLGVNSITGRKNHAGSMDQMGEA